MSDEITCKNAVTCTICRSPADRIGGPEKCDGFHGPSHHYRCQANPNHVGDPFVAIFSDLAIPEIATDPPQLPPNDSGVQGHTPTP